MSLMFHKVAFIGLGLIGSSLARVLRAQGLAGEIVASTRSASTLEEAKRLGVIDAGFRDPAEAVQDADLIVLAMPVCATEAVLRAIAPHMRTDAILTDVGSTKGNVVAAALAVFGAVLPSGFVPAHPIAGGEKTGVAAGHAQLFAHHKIIITPLPSSSADAIARVTHMWRAAHADVLTMTEAGYPRVEAYNWYALYVPLQTPQARVDQLNAAVRKVLTTDPYRARLLESPETVPWLSNGPIVGSGRP